eukprot:CAMPEP_0185446156 /NCGR_PEP_ID=MMETSP1365-20130426/53623_1 /TAXON_ID=38817 /ORGANISM="Gephyrocapsa oceanica, Strain RCC1303" /LENGTH=171 /DNA_ID=CAMNT_0028051953 /DNA_START=42 /DNA_END=554 /DNA_ORIENTATION=+
MCPLSGRTAWKPPSPELRGEQRRHPADPFPLPLVESVGTLRDGDEHLEAQNDVRPRRRTAEGEGGGRKAASSPHRRSTADPAVCGSARSFAATAASGTYRPPLSASDAANASPLGSAAEEGSRPLRSSGSTRTPPPPAASPGSAYSATALAAVWRRRVAAAHCARLEREAS